MENDTVDSIMQDLSYVLRIIRKKFMKIDFEGANRGITHFDFAIMSMLDELGALPVSNIGERLLIPKPQMTHLLDRLMRLGVVERLPDTRDRRIIRVSLTRKGRSVLKEYREVIRNSLRKNLACLEAEELEQLSALLARLRDIGGKLESRRSA
jgi:DNA-binding MarR family transcriptional regulator